MRITFKVAFDEQNALELLNALARVNERILRHPKYVGRFPLLYDSGVVYRRERDETWSDVVNTLAQGHEDCDALAAWRAGELRARGAAALRPGDGGHAEALRQRLTSIPAEVMLTTRTREGRPGLYHCVARYQVGGAEFTDDPSARLGMFHGRVDPKVRGWWQKLGITPASAVADDRAWEVT